MRTKQSKQDWRSKSLGVGGLGCLTLRNVQYLIVNPLMPHLSDHCHLSFALKANLFSFDPPGGSILIEHKRLF